MMKKGFLFLMLIAGVMAKAQQKQSLKDLLYSGKLKLDSTAVIKKDDDLTTRIDTATKKPAEPEKPKGVTTVSEAVKTAAPVTTATTAVDNSGEGTTAPETAVKENAPVKSNTKIWKEYTDSLISSLKTEFLSSKKIKKETYFITVDYEINPDGTISTAAVTSDPVNALLQSEIKQRLDITPPVLAPVPKKVKRKQAFTITKD